MARVLSTALHAISFAAESLLGFISIVRNGKPGNNDIDAVFRKIHLAKTVYVVNHQNLTQEEYVVLVFLQGLTAKKEAAIYIDDSIDTYDMHRKYIKEYQKRYVDTGKSNVTFDYSIQNMWTLVEMFKDSFDSKFVTYGSFEESDPTINMAATIAGVDCVLGIPAALRDEALAHGLTEVRDLRTIKGDYIEKQKAIFEEYKDKLNKHLLIHVNPQDIGVRDLGIANDCFHFFTHDRENSPRTFLPERGFRHEVYRWSEYNALILGFWAWGDEIVFLDDMSHYGKSFLPHSGRNNGTLLMALEGKEKVAQSWRVNDAVPKAKAVEGKHTIAFYVTDGDNISGGEKGGGVCAPYETMLKQRATSGDTFKMTYSIAPLLGKLSPFTAEYLYDNEDSYGLGEYDSYVGCTSGMSIINASSYPRRTLKSFAKMTAETMDRMDIRVMTPIDQIWHNMFFIFRTKDIWGKFAKYDSINGGIWQIDVPRYYVGRGLVVWAKGKPWVSVRTALWGPDDTHNSVTHEWLDKIAVSLNQRCTNPHKIDGYSVIGIHPWSIHYSDIHYLVSKLDMDKVQLVFGEELIDMVTENVPHRFAIPKRELAN
ncbi:MAG: hypothetical protein LBC83_00980 [Oscillospiraceae bacterium]|nr:hypothetical protein [Oscillospiraceae bacterium]